ncbi:hypothetical protein J6590_105596 [Homalodisca vitripennis]|nr:hypothetical protein J6590_105596 [Homalodisca vitripennis]
MSETQTCPVPIDTVIRALSRRSVHCLQYVELRSGCSVGHRRISILIQGNALHTIDIQAALMALDSCMCVCSTPKWSGLLLGRLFPCQNQHCDCLLGSWSRGDERADTLANQGSVSNMMGPQPLCGISRCKSFGAVSKCVRAEYERRWRLHPSIRMSSTIVCLQGGA